MGGEEKPLPPFPGQELPVGQEEALGVQEAVEPPGLGGAFQGKGPGYGPLEVGEKPLLAVFPPLGGGLPSGLGEGLGQAEPQVLAPA